MKITKSYFERWGPCRLAASSEKASAVVELPIRSWVPTAVRPSIGPHASHSNRVGLGRRLTNQRLGPITPKGSQSPYIREHLSSFIFHLSSFIFRLSSFRFLISALCSESCNVVTLKSFFSLLNAPQSRGCLIASATRALLQVPRISGFPGSPFRMSQTLC